MNERIYEIIDEQGWNDSNLVGLFEDFILENNLETVLETYLLKIQAEENKEE